MGASSFGCHIAVRRNFPAFPAVGKPIKHSGEVASLRSLTENVPMRKTTLIIISALLTLAGVGTGMQSNPANAQGGSTPPNEFPVSVQVTGVIQSITATELTLTDGSVIQINSTTQGLSPALRRGVTVTVVAAVEGDVLVALSIAAGDAGPEPAITVTPAATVSSPSQSGDTGGNGNGKGKGKGKDKDKDKGKGKGNGKDKDKGKVDAKVAACLKNIKQPTAARLADLFDVPLLEILTWHCKGKGYGEITRAYLLAQRSTLTVEEIFAMRDDGEGWGDIVEGAGLNPKDFSSGSIVKGKNDKGKKGD
jgi:hypothetical protein